MRDRIFVVSMKISQRTLRIGASSLLALSFVGVAYVLSGPSLFTQRTVSAESTEEILAAYAAKDTDGDTLPDWQEALYNTDPTKSDTDGDGVSDGEAVRQGRINPSTLAAQLPEEPTGEELLEDIPGVDPAPGSITEQFAQSFLETYAAASAGTPLSEEGQQQLVAELFSQFSQQAASELESRYSLVSVRTSTTIGVLAYVDSVERVLFINNVGAGEGEPLMLMQALVEQDDESARPKLERLASTYASIRDSLLGLSVPPALADEHLLLIQSFDSLARATEIVTEYERDPLGVMGALTVFVPSSRKTLEGIEGIALAVLSYGEPVEGAAGAALVNTARSIQTP